MMIILKWILKKKNVDWIHLAESKDHWRDLMNTALNEPIL
jgi:hypothetical protein